MASAPIIDFKECGLNVEDFSAVSNATLKTLGKTIIDAFKTYGFCYLKNHGVDEDLILDYRKASREFFILPDEEKTKYTILSDYRFGWVKLEAENLNKDRPPTGDLHEAFNYCPAGDTGWPPVEHFEILGKKMFESCSELARRFLDVLSLGLDLPRDFFRNAHSLIGKDGNCSAVRTLYYPPISPGLEVKPGQVRLGEHADYGTATFTFQDNVGGMEMKNPSGVFLPVTPIEGTVTVHTSTLLQRWTSDVIKETVHRILIPEDEERKKKERQSVVYFAQPDDECLIECIDGSNKYKPTTSVDYLKFMYDKIIQ